MPKSPENKNRVTVRVWASENPNGKSDQQTDLERSHAELRAALIAATRHIRSTGAENPLLAQMRRALRNARTAGTKEASQSNAVPVPLSTRMDPLKIAVRVLTAVSEKHPPIQTDLNTLTRLYGPKSETAGWDEYTCDVIQTIMRDRAAGRTLLRR